jgi:hypothetical protein
MRAVSLKARFASFMASGNYAESVDALTKVGHPHGCKKADYLAFHRSIIIEQKSLDQDVDAKVRTLLTDLVREHGPIVREPARLADIIEGLKRLPSGNRFVRRLHAVLTQPIDNLLARANAQTRDTRLTFLIPKAIGVVVVLNEDAQLIEPDYFQDKAWNMFRKELEPGKLRYPENQVAILISEAHRDRSVDGAEVIPTETTFSEAGAENPLALAFVNDFLQRWAEHNGAIASELSGKARIVETRDPAKVLEAI